MGFLRDLFRRRPAPAAPELHPLARTWNFTDDSEWKSRTLDSTSLQVFADWLEEKGDARFELIRLAPTPERFDAFVRANAHALYGPLTKFILHRAAGRFSEGDEHGQIEPQWEHGVLRGVSVRTRKPWRDAPAFLELPVARTVRSLAIGIPDALNPVASAEDWRVLEPFADRLEELFFCDFDYPTECEMSWAQVGDLSALWRTLPKLKRVKLRGYVETLGTVVAPELTHFTFESSGIAQDEVRALADAQWPKLTHLELWLGSQDRGCDCAAADLVPLLSAKLPSLISLGLRNYEFADGLINRLADSPVVARVKRLDLSMGCLTEAGVEDLLERAKAFAHLDELVLDENYIRAEYFERLSKLCKTVSFADQRIQEDEYRFPSVTE